MSRWRRLLVGLLLAVALLAIAGATVPWWVPPALGALGPRWGVSFGSWESHGWSGTTYHGLTVAGRGFRIEVGTVKTPVLGVWPRTGDTLLLAEDVVVNFEKAPPREGAPPASAARVAQQILETWSRVEKHLPRARVNRLTVRLPDSPRRYVVDEIAWDGANLRAAGPSPVPDRPGRIEIQARHPAAETVEFAAQSTEPALRVEGRASATAGALDATAQVLWSGNEAAVAAHFGPQGWLPQTASVEAPSLAVDAALLGLRGYGPVQGSLTAAWKDGSFSLKADARAQALPEDESLPPAAVEMEAAGDLEWLRVQVLRISLPGVLARLSEPVRVSWRTGMPESKAVFTLDVDAALTPWTDGRGELHGLVEAVLDPSMEPELRFSLSGESLRLRGGDIESVALSGRWKMPTLSLEQGELKLAEDSVVRASGAIDVRARTIHDAKLDLRVTGAAVRPWWPQAPAFTLVVVESRLDGAISQPVHRGLAQVRGFQAQPDVPLDGDVRWEGEGVARIAASGEVRTRSGIVLPFSGTVARELDGAVSVRLDELAWRDSSSEWWHLAEPAVLKSVPAANPPAGNRALTVEDFRLEGVGMSLEASGRVRWPSAGELSVAMHGIDAQRLGWLVPEAARGITLETLQAQAAWDHGPVRADGSLRMSQTLSPQTAYAVEADFQLRPEGDATAALRVLDRTAGLVLEGEARLPVSLSGDESGFSWNIPADGELAVNLSSSPNPAFWDSISQLSGWGVDEPRLSIALTGPMSAPRGRVELAATRVRPRPDLVGQRARLPALDWPRLVVVADEQGVALSEGMFAIDGNWLTLKGRAPWSWWRELRETGRPDWWGVDFAVAAAPMPVSVISRVVPNLVTSEGQVSLDLKHQAGRGFTGRFWLHNAATRPIAPVGAVRAIDGVVQADGYALELTRLTAQLGGQPLEIAGTAGLSPGGRLEFDFQLHSTGVPVVRQPGVIVRAGLDLRVVKRGPAPARVAGQVRFGRSLFVSDLIAMLPGGDVASPSRRPPYFSVPDPPFADWTLDIALSGDEFLRLENPLARGTFSADFKLEGTLKEPRVIGRAWSQDTAVSFPFARLALDHVEVALSETNPYEPRVTASGGTRIFSYDVRMEVSGPVNEPVLTFASTPPMTSQEAFLMLTTGALPSQDVAFSTSDRAQRFAMFLGRNLASGLGLGGRSGEERLAVRSGENFTREGRETVYVQYDLDGRWSVFGEYDRFDAYNGGLKFRIVDR